MDLSLDDMSLDINKNNPQFWEGKEPLKLCFKEHIIKVDRYNMYMKSDFIKQILNSLPDIDTVEIDLFISTDGLEHIENYINNSILDTNIISQSSDVMVTLIQISNYLIIPDLCSMLMTVYGKTINVLRETFDDYHKKQIQKIGINL